MTQKLNHTTTLRLALETHRWIERFAEQWGVSPSYVYRAAIKAFMLNKSGAN